MEEKLIAGLEEEKYKMSPSCQRARKPSGNVWLGHRTKVSLKGLLVVKSGAN